MISDLPKVFKRIKKKRIQLVVGMLITCFVLVLVRTNVPVITPGITMLNHLIYDRMVSLYLRKDIRPVRVVIVDIDERSVKVEGRWPWPRDKFAALLTRLQQAKVVTAGLDIVMSEPEINYAIGLKDKLKQLGPSAANYAAALPALLDKIAPLIDNDTLLVKVLAGYDVVLGFLFHDENDVKKGQLPPPLTDEKGQPFSANEYTIHSFNGYNASFADFINASKHGGFVSNLPDSDGAVRHGLTVAAYDGRLYPSLALAVAMRYLLVDHLQLMSKQYGGKKHLYGLQLDGAFIPTNEKGEVYIPFWGGPKTLEYYSATDVLNGAVDANALAGAVVIVGSSMILLADLHDSPVATLFPGVEMVGNLVTGIAGQQIIAPYEWQEPSGLVILAVVGLFLVVLLPFLSVSRMFFVSTMSLVGILGMTLFCFVYQATYVPAGYLLVLLFCLTALNYIVEFINVKRQKSQINQLFGQYVPEQYVKGLLESPELYTMEGKTREMTAFFTDIRGFSGLSEGLDASGVKRLLNTFFTPLTEIVFNHQGTIDKYVGDMVVAFWGAPIDDPLHATHAITASLAIFKKLPAINETMIASGLPAVNIGIGLGSGLMNVGDMGSAFRRAYTVLGDTVNLASRLQDLTKFYHLPILTNDGCRAGQDGFLWYTVDKVAVKGRKQASMIYHPICAVSEGTDALRQEIEDYERALADYYAKAFVSAKQQFEALREQHPTVYLYQMYLERIAEFELTPPPDDWDGVFVQLHK